MIGRGRLIALVVVGGVGLLAGVLTGMVRRSEPPPVTRIELRAEPTAEPAGPSRVDVVGRQRGRATGEQGSEGDDDASGEDEGGDDDSIDDEGSDDDSRDDEGGDDDSGTDEGAGDDETLEDNPPEVQGSDADEDGTSESEGDDDSSDDEGDDD